MTTPTGTISMTDIQTEFGGSNPIGLNEYYAGGSYVPAGLSGVPSSGAISMDNLRGKSKITPYSVVATTSSVAEGSQFQVQITPAATVYGVVYWKLTDYSNLQDADFVTVSGAVSLDFENQTYPVVTFNVAEDTTIEGTGTFKFSVYSNSARTLGLGQSTTLTVTDTYTTTMVEPTNSTLYRYANLNSSSRASVVYMDTTGLEGSTVYYQVYPSSGSLTAADVDAPVSLTGTLTVPTGGRVGLTVRSTEWNGTQDITVDKTLYVRYRLTNSTGAILGTSTAIILKAMPVVSFSFSPSTITEGQSSTLTGSATNIPYDGSASFFWRQSTTFGTAVVADWVQSAGDPGTLTGELIWTSQVVNTTFYAALDSLAESTENVYLFWYTKDPNTGIPFWQHSLNIQSPAQITSATGSYSSVQITDISSYPVSRTFTVTTQADSSLNTASSLTVAAGQTSSAAIEPFDYVATNGNAGIYNMRYIISNPAYQTYTVVKNNESFIFPVYGVTFEITGTNTNGSPRTIKVTITSVPSLGYARTFTVDARIKAAGGATWGAWTAQATTLNVPLNSTSSSATTVFSTAGANAQYDIQLRLVRDGHETKTSQEFNGIWL